MEDSGSCRKEPQFRVFPSLKDCILFTGNSKSALKSIFFRFWEWFAR